MYEKDKETTTERKVLALDVSSFLVLLVSSVRRKNVRTIIRYVYREGHTSPAIIHVDT